MGKVMKKLFSICVRGVSNGVPGKNTRLLKGKPLFVHSLNQAKKSKIFDFTAVSSDSTEILDLAKRNGADIVIDEQFFKQEAADIVKNNIPNYDYVSDFVKSLRKLPIGNFVSFPAEIARTGTNIVRRGLRETQQQFRIKGQSGLVKPFESIGYTRLFGFGATTVAVPYGVSEMFKALYNVTSEEMEALKRYVPDWSKNSTLIPIRKEDGSFKVQHTEYGQAPLSFTIDKSTVVDNSGNFSNSGDTQYILEHFLDGSEIIYNSSFQKRFNLESSYVDVGEIINIDINHNFFEEDLIYSSINSSWGQSLNWLNIDEDGIISGVVPDDFEHGGGYISGNYISSGD